MCRGSKSMASSMSSTSFFTKIWAQTGRPSSTKLKEQHQEGFTNETPMLASTKPHASQAL